MGDFNYRDIHWPTLQTKGEGQELLDLLQDQFLYQIVDKPTRGKNILDLLISNELDMIHDLEIYCPIANSDHNLMTWSIIHDMKLNIFDEKKNYSKGDYESINEAMNATDWTNKFTDMSLDQMWSHFVKTFNEYQDKYIPVLKARDRTSPPWLSKDIMKQIRTRNRSWFKFKQCPSYTNECKYKKNQK